jgi:hypothetical protein
MTGQQMLDRAADRIERVGWRHPTSGGNLGHCPITALCAEHDYSASRFEDAVECLRARIGGGSIVQWNDAPEQTMGRVVATMRGEAA